MQQKFRRSGQAALDKLLASSRHPEVVMLAPALSLAAFWLGGVQALVAAAVMLPVVLMLTKYLFGSQSGRGAEPGPRATIVAFLDKAFQSLPAAKLSTVCLVLKVDETDKLSSRYGHAIQADVFSQMLGRLQAAVRESDLIVPVGNEAFAIALAPVRRLDLETVLQMAARFQAVLAEPFSCDASRLYATASVGFCLSVRSPKGNGSALLEAAQIAADDAVRHGPGAIRAFSAEMARLNSDRETMRHDLERALDEGQITAFFQPQISTDTGEISGFEALARWHHPERGLVAPADFLPQIEAAGLSEKLEEVMLFNALSALKTWDRAGFNVPRVSVNFSCSNLRSPKLVERLKWELDRFDLRADRLCVEVLENVVANTDDDVVVANLSDLAAFGCQIDLDDFGTGHASITSIRRFPLRRLKIDRSFVTRVDMDREQQKMVAAILSMAGQLGLETLAEGVETAAEHSMLAQLGCNEVQGFGIGRPMPLPESSEWIIRHVSQRAVFPRIGTRIR